MLKEKKIIQNEIKIHKIRKNLQLLSLSSLTTNLKVLKGFQSIKKRHLFKFKIISALITYNVKVL